MQFMPLKQKVLTESRNKIGPMHGPLKESKEKWADGTNQVALHVKIIGGAVFPYLPPSHFYMDASFLAIISAFCFLATMTLKRSKSVSDALFF